MGYKRSGEVERESRKAVDFLDQIKGAPFLIKLGIQTLPINYAPTSKELLQQRLILNKSDLK